MEHIEFHVSGNTLKGSLFFPKTLKEKNPAILFIHGWTSARNRSFQYAEKLADLGYISFLFDMRGHGESGGNLTETSSKEFLDDCIAAYDFIANVKGVDPEQISVIGSSFGSYLASILTSKRNVRQLALRVPADYPNDVFNLSKMKTSGKDNPDIFTWRKQIKSSKETFALEAMSHYQGNVLILESGNDNLIPHETILNYINAIPDKTKVTHIIIEGAPHSIKDGPFKDEIEKNLLNWFKKD
jgi:uncharacterized protein